MRYISGTSSCRRRVRSACRCVTLSRGSQLPERGIIVADRATMVVWWTSSLFQLQNTHMTTLWQSSQRRSPARREWIHALPCLRRNKIKHACLRAFTAQHRGRERKLKGGLNDSGRIRRGLSINRISLRNIYSVYKSCKEQS